MLLEWRVVGWTDLEGGVLDIIVRGEIDIEANEDSRRYDSVEVEEVRR